MIYEYWFAGLKPLSDEKKKRLRGIFGSGRELFYLKEKELSALSFLTEKDREVLKKAKKDTGFSENYEEIQKKGIRLLLCHNNSYPESLKKIKDHPYALYVKGKLPDGKRKAAAIVGARRCTPYGEEMARIYGYELARAGVEIISGMAKGIDGAGQRGALEAGGSTFAVLGCGVDICYPRDHIGLYMDIQQNGGILSEQCPGEPPLPCYFPQRNRIISALSDVILVMEAREKSGSLITADLGLEQGKDIYALPGPASSVLSAGCHRLISQGAGILLSPGELLNELNVKIVKLRENNNKEKKELETIENMVYSCLDLFPRSVDGIVSDTGLPPGKVLEILTTLEIEGMTKELSKGYYIKIM